MEKKLNYAGHCIRIRIQIIMSENKCFNSEINLLIRW